VSLLLQAPVLPEKKKKEKKKEKKEKYSFTFWG
jgi:hypothetical protein